MFYLRDCISNMLKSLIPVLRSFRHVFKHLVFTYFLIFSCSWFRVVLENKQLCCPTSATITMAKSSNISQADYDNVMQNRPENVLLPFILIEC